MPNVSDLHKMASTHKIKGHSKMKKAALIEALILKGLSRESLVTAKKKSVRALLGPGISVKQPKALKPDKLKVLDQIQEALAKIGNRGKSQVSASKPSNLFTNQAEPGLVSAANAAEAHRVANLEAKHREEIDAFSQNALAVKAQLLRPAVEAWEYEHNKILRELQAKEESERSYRSPRAMIPQSLKMYIRPESIPLPESESEAEPVPKPNPMLQASSSLARVEAPTAQSIIQSQPYAESEDIPKRSRSRPGGSSAGSGLVQNELGASTGPEGIKRVKIHLGTGTGDKSTGASHLAFIPKTVGADYRGSIAADSRVNEPGTVDTGYVVGQLPPARAVKVGLGAVSAEPKVQGAGLIPTNFDNLHSDIYKRTLAAGMDRYRTYLR